MIQTFIRQILEDLEIKDAGWSPLSYNWRARRLSIIDHDFGDPLKSDMYFSKQEHWRKRSSSGRLLKKPVLDETIPGAEPGTIAFLDYHGDNEILYLDYLKVRQDLRGKGYARKLIEELIRMNPDITVLQFGRMMQPQIGHLMQDLKIKHAGKIEVSGSKYY